MMGAGHGAATDCWMPTRTMVRREWEIVRKEFGVTWRRILVGLRREVRVVLTEE
jgi:hypothetical protein